MENATNALLMAGGVLIGILILSLAVYLFTTFGGTASKVNDQNVQVQLTQFNEKFTKYEGISTNTIYDVITVAGLARENNLYYDNNSDYLIQVFMGSTRLDNNSQLNNRGNLINSNLDNFYDCTVSYNSSSGRVSEVRFTKNN